MKKYAVIGNPIKQSKSPFIHQAFAKQTALPITYEAILGDTNNVAETISSFVSAGGLGLNVTAPFKEDAFRLSTQLSERARYAQAVNTLSFLDNGQVLGDNTDGVGLVSDLIANFGELSGKRLIVLGAGGATRGVIKSLFDAGIKHIHIANRTQDKAKNLAEHFAQAGSVSFSDLAAVGDRGASIVINATSTGVNDQKLAIDDTVFEQVVCCYDMFYSKEITPFNAYALKVNPNCKISDGLGMLVSQAAESFYIWTGVRPNATPVLSELRNLI